jgi:protein-arginine kinase activator protein McsA
LKLRQLEAAAAVLDRISALQREHEHDDEDDMFYLCRECTRFENEHNHGDTDMAFGVMEDGEYDYDQYEDQSERARRGDYDHSEECS